MRSCVKHCERITALQRTQGSTTLFVTHDQIEALTMADRIAVLNEGRYHPGVALLKTSTTGQLTLLFAQSLVGSHASI